MNAIVIEQSQDETKLAFEVHRNADIHRIRLARAKVFSQPVDAVSETRIAVAFTFRSKALSAPANVLRLEIAFRMVGTEEQADDTKPGPERRPDPVVLVDCAYEMDYLLRDVSSLPPNMGKRLRMAMQSLTLGPTFANICRIISSGWGCRLSPRLSYGFNPN